MTQYAIFLHFEDADSEAFGPFSSRAKAKEVFDQLLGDGDSGVSSDTIVSLEPLRKATPGEIKACIARHPEAYDDDEADELQEAEVDDDGLY